MNQSVSLTAVLSAVTANPSLFRAARLPVLILAGLLLILSGVPSQSRAAQPGSIYRCTTNTGVIEYSNSEPSETGGRQCDELELPTITTIPAPKLPKTTKGDDDSEAGASKGFPKVSTARQQSRDDARKKILRKEMSREREKLKALREEFQSGEPERHGDERNYQKYLDRVESMRADISRGENNISALQRELKDLN